MRRRLAVAFMVVTLASVLGAGLVRTLTISSQLEDQELAHLHREAQVALAQITRVRADGGKVTSELLASLVTDQSRLQYDAPGGRRVEASGSSFATSTAESGSLSATAYGLEGTVVATQSRQPLEAAYRRDLPTVLTLLTVVTMLAGVVGSFAARLLAAPFRRLASAAHALGRGRLTWTCRIAGSTRPSPSPRLCAPRPAGWRSSAARSTCWPSRPPTCCARP